MTHVLTAAGIYNIFWAMQAICWPNWLFQWAGLPLPTYPELWQALGIFVGAWGVGFMVAAPYPLRHWPVVLAGLVGYVAAAGGLLKAGGEHRFPWMFCCLVAASGIIWWIPLGIILWCAYKAQQTSQRYASPAIQHLALRARTNKGRSLQDMSTEKPLLIVFLRTTDCPFCRESLLHLAAARPSLERKDVELVLVHMSQDQPMHEFLLPYGLSDVPRVSDPDLHLYRAFGLRRGPLWRVIGPQVWFPGIMRWIHYGAGRLTFDLLQMPGVFFVFHGEVLWNFVHQSIADQPNYRDIPVPL